MVNKERGEFESIRVIPKYQNKKGVGSNPQGKVRLKTCLG